MLGIANRQPGRSVAAESRGIVIEPNTSVSSYLDVFGVRVHYRASGAGEQLLVLHGWGSSIDTMARVCDELANHYNVFALDFPGHGKSDLPPKPWSVSDYTECLVQFMDILGLERPHILAHSFGGRVTVWLAKYHPLRANKMILVDSAGVRPPRPLKYYLKIGAAKLGKVMAAYGGTLGKKFRDYVYTRVGSKDYASAGPMRSTFVKVVNEDQTNMLSDVQSPTLLIWGADDKETPLKLGEEMARLIPNASLVVMENAGHFSFIDQPHKFNLIVRKFLRD